VSRYASANAVTLTTPDNGKNACANRQRNCGPGNELRSFVFLRISLAMFNPVIKAVTPAFAPQGEAERDN
jgi:hypothetical protein